MTKKAFLLSLTRVELSPRLSSSPPPSCSLAKDEPRGRDEKESVRQLISDDTDDSDVDDSDREVVVDMFSVVCWSRELWW